MSPWPVRFFLYLQRRLRPPLGWLGALALFLCVCALASGIAGADWMRRAPSFYPPALLSAYVGLWLAGRTRRIWVAFVVLSSAGLLMATMAMAQAWPPLPLLWQNLTANLRSLAGEPLNAEIVPLGPWLGDRLSLFASRMAAWWSGASSRTASTTALQFISYLVVWGVSAWSGWAAVRWQRALVSLLPAGIVLGTILFFSQKDFYWLSMFILGLVMLSTHLRAYTLQSHWEEETIDYSPEYRIELYLMGLAIAFAVAAAMLVVPSVRIGAVTNAFWGVFRDPWLALEARAQRAFPELDRTPRSLIAGGSSGTGGLPRSHLLGDHPELRQRQVMTVRTSDAVIRRTDLIANYRWRGLTYATYTGSGWSNAQGLEERTFPPGQVWQSAILRGRRPVRQFVQITDGRSRWLFAASDPIAADHGALVYHYDSGDLAGAEINASEYTVISQVPDVSMADLRLVPLFNSPNLVEYLTLPETVPARVGELAAEITRDAITPFDKAMAIEGYLRTYPYNLEVPKPPSDRDVTDYFLFDLRQGYCDYYASAMVVMARSIGLPARLAIGYAAGDYNAEENHFVVVEANAHTWPEIYFAGYGWIPFEPTAAQPQYVREPVSLEADQLTAAEDLSLSAELGSLRRRGLFLYSVWRWSLVPLLILLGATLFIRIRREYRLRRQAENAWQLAYLRLQVWGDRVGVTPAPWYTPREYSRRWSNWLQSIDQHVEDAQTAMAEIRRLRQSLEAAAYAPTSQRPEEDQAKVIWQRLEGALRRLRWRQRLGRLPLANVEEET